MASLLSMLHSHHDPDFLVSSRHFHRSHAPRNESDDHLSPRQAPPRIDPLIDSSVSTPFVSHRFCCLWSRKVSKRGSGYTKRKGRVNKILVISISTILLIFRWNSEAIRRSSGGADPLKQFVDRRNWHMRGRVVVWLHLGQCMSESQECPSLKPAAELLGQSGHLRGITPGLVPGEQ